MKYTVLIAALFTVFSSFGCGNEYGHSLDGERVFTRYFYLSNYYRHFDKEQIRKHIGELRQKSDATSFERQSDIALNLLKLGHTDSALMILEPLIKEHPDEYIINANLGTAYELDGQLENALKYIKQGLAINADSHLGSEWVHIKILEAKIKEKQQPGWLRNHRIVSMEELHQVTGDSPRYHHQFNHLQLQIRTRAPFTPAPNKVMANLLETLAEYSVEYNSYENAVLAYTYLMEFDPASKRRVAGIIRSMTEKRRASGIDELPFMFKRLIERAEIDPELLLLGLDGVEEELQTEHEHQLAYMDSLEQLDHANDSLQLLLDEVSSKDVENNKQAPANTSWIVSLILGACTLTLLIILFLKRRK